MEAHRSNRPAKAALADLLRERGQANEVGNVRFERFYKAVEELKAGYGAKHLRRMVDGGRPLQPDAIEAMARVLDVEPEYFLEYRVWQIGKVLERHPDAEELLYDIAMDVAEDRDGARPKAGKGE